MAEGGWKQSPAVAAVAVVALIVAGYFIYSRVSGGASGGTFGGTQYFLDLSSGELVTSDSMKSPIQIDGSEAVRAHVFSCGSCEDQNARFVGYVRSFTEQANAAMDIPAEEREPFVIQAGTMVSAYEDAEDWQPTWVSAESGEGMMIQEIARTKCNGQYAECMP